MPRIGSTTFPGLRITDDGKIQWLYASGATANLLEMRVAADTQPRLRIRADGRLLWGSGAAALDAQLYRSAANTLKSDDTVYLEGSTLTVEGAFSFSGTYRLLVSGDAQYRMLVDAAGAHAWGSGAAAQDCQLSRNAANELRTPDQLTVQAGVSTYVKAGVPADGDFPTALDGLIAIDSVANRLYVRHGAGWHWVALT